MSKIPNIARRGGAGTSRGQSLVEFALISIVLFAIIMGIVEVARLLFIYSVVSNAAQEGSRYGITRPRDVIGSTAATQTATAGTPTYIPEQVIADGSCNVTDKTREKVFGLDRDDVEVFVWYDIGDSTPVVVSQDPSSPSYFNDVIVKGNRIAVEAKYTFHFLVPFFDTLAPGGIDVKIRSARTILSNGDIPGVPCTFNWTPAPTRTPTSTRTPTYTPTPSSTQTETPTPVPTNTPTETSTPSETTTPTSSPTKTPTPTGTISPVLTPTYTNTPTPCGSCTDTPTRTHTTTPTRTPTKTRTPTITATRTITATPSITSTPTITATPTITPTPSKTDTPVKTNTPVAPPTPVPTP